MNRWIGLAVLAAATSVAHAQPEPLVFRVVRWSVYDLRDHQLTTYALARDGDAVRLRVELSTGTLSDPRKEGSWTWKAERTVTYAGTARTVKGSTVLDLVPGDDQFTYSCKTMTVQVAAATAIREMIRGHERLSNGRWPRGVTTTTSALFCKNVQNRHPGVYPHHLANELVFSTRGIEHVLADDNCCNRPGDSLRWIPRDRSVTPGR